MLKKNIECNQTHTIGAFEIIRYICIEASTQHVAASLIGKTLEELLRWVARGMPSQRADGKSELDPEKRLRQGTLFCKLTLVSRAGPYEKIVKKYRAGLDALIKEEFGRQLDAMQGVTGKPSSFPYLAKYLAWRGLE